MFEDNNHRYLSRFCSASKDLQNLVQANGLNRPRFANPNVVILPHPTDDTRCLKYVVDPLTKKPLGPDLQKIVLQGLGNQIILTEQNLEGVQGAYRQEGEVAFAYGIPGLLELEYVKGETWWASHYEDFDPERLLAEGQEFHATLTKMHSSFGIMHNDIKPFNVVIGSTKKLIDFSLSMDASEHHTYRGKTIYEIGVIGSPQYMEQSREHFTQRDYIGLGRSMLEILFSYSYDQEEIGFLTFEDWQNYSLQRLQYVYSKELTDFIGFLVNHKPQDQPHASQRVSYNWRHKDALAETVIEKPKPNLKKRLIQNPTYDPDAPVSNEL